VTRRALVVNADDFGRTAGINAGVIAGFERGIVTSASLMTRWPAATAAAEYLRAYPELGGGLHVDLGEWYWSDHGWRARYEVVAPADQRATRDAAAMQLEQFRALVGRNPTHLDSHQHVHRREPARTALLELAAELAVPLRHFSTVRYNGEFYGQDERGEPLADRLTVENLVDVLARLEGGVTELACHPAARDDIDDAYGALRLVELEVLCDPRVAAAVRCADIERVSFASIADRRQERDETQGARSR
jgi:predicted glycoside hydrolase/deacetylase ChbG (UPF0249 family)